MSNPAVPRYYYRIAENFDYIYGKHLVSYNEYKSQNNTISNYAMFQSIKAVFISYRKLLKDILKYKGVKKYFPTDVFEYCKKNNIIDDADIWLDFIKVINIIISKNITNTNHEIFEHIVDKYLEAPHLAKEKVEHFKNTLPKYELPPPPEWLNDSKPLYNYEEWGTGITLEMYNVILTYFKSKPMIKNAWLFGSRGLGTAKKNSDIDILLDMPLEHLADINEELLELRVPYIIDPHCLIEEHVKENKIRERGKLVYRRKDFFEDKEVLQDLPRYYYRITQKFYEKYNDFSSLYSKCDKNNLTDVDVVKLFKPFKDLFQTYYQCLGDVLKYNKKIVLFPDEIVLMAQEEDLIDDAEDWLDYIKLLDLVVMYNNTPNLCNVLHAIFEKYPSKLNKMKSNLDMIISNLPKYEYYTHGIPDPEQKAIYHTDILGAGVTVEMYNIIMSYFKSKPYIKKVWAFGSRVKGEARLHSDIDLAIDYPIEYKDEVENDLLELRIPYFVDGKNIYDPENKKFLSNMFLGTYILIYSREDFVKK